MLIDEILFHVPCPIFWKDLNSIFLGCNKLFLPISGFQHYEQLIGKSDAELPWRKKKNDYYKDDQYVIKTGETITKIEEIKTSDHTIISETTKTPLTKNGEIIGVLGICLDITAKQENNQLATQLKAQSIFKKCMDEIQHSIQTARVSAVNNAAGIKSTTRNIVEKVKLTKRESEVMYLLGIGKSTKQIADIISRIEGQRVKHTTIGSVINKQLFQKLDVGSQEQLIEKATLLKLIPFVHESFLSEE